MSPAKSVKPEFYKTLMRKDFFPQSNKIVKYHESVNYWMFKTGEKVYKVKKPEPEKSQVSLEEIFCLETVRQIRLHSPSLQPEIITLKRQDDTFVLDWNQQLPGPVQYYGIVMNQLPDRYFLDRLIAKKRLKPAIMDRIATFLHSFHQQTPEPATKANATEEDTLTRLNDLIYQSKKYLGVTVTQPMIDRTYRPLEKYITEHRRQIQRRHKHGTLKEVHGCFIPRKINVQPDLVAALAKTTDPLRDRFRDIASDLADLTVELVRVGNQSHADQFVESYRSLSGDDEIGLILPIYQALKCLSLGVKHSVIAARADSEIAESERRTAQGYYKQAIEVVPRL